MKRFINILILYIVYFLLGTLQACINDDCRFNGSINFQRTTSFENSLVELTSIEERGNFGEEFYNYEFVQPDDTIRYSELGIVISPLIDQIAQRINRGNIFNCSYACSPAFFYENITGINVETLNDYNPGFPGDANINEIILVRQSFKAVGLSIESFLNFGSGRESDGYDFFLRLSQPPDDTLQLALNISITMDDERTYKTKIDSIVITP